MKTLIYVRKSSESEDRQVLSTESQTKELLSLAERLSTEVELLPPESKSAKMPGRPIFNSVLGKIESGECENLWVWHPDRISRNPEDSGRIISLIDAGKLFSVVTPSQTFKNTPMDKFMLGFLMMQAKLDNDAKGVNVKRGLKTKAEKGWLPSGAKPGYKNDKRADKGDKRLYPDPKRYPLIRKCWELLLSGAYTVAEILHKLNNEWGYRTPKHKRIGGKPMSRSMLYRIFSDPFYNGEFRYPNNESGEWFIGKHKPMITKEEFDKVQVILGRKNCRRPQKNFFTFTGIIRCGECGAMVTAEEKWQIICSSCKHKFSSQNKNKCPKCITIIEEMKSPKILHYTYYHCTKRKGPCSQKSISPTDLEEQIDNILSSIEISPEFTDWAIKYLNELNNHDKEDRKASSSSLKEAHKDCSTRIDNLLALYISPQNRSGDLITEQEFKSQKQGLMQEKLSLEEKMSDSNHSYDHWIEASEKIFNFARSARQQFSIGDKETKRQIFVSLGSNITLKDKIVRMELEKPLEHIQSAVTYAEIISTSFEPKKKSYTSAQLSSIFWQNPTLLPELDSNQRP